MLATRKETTFNIDQREDRKKGSTRNTLLFWQ